MLEIPKAKDPDLIDKKEYRKRRMRKFRKHGKTIAEIMNFGFENKISWGRIVETSTQRYPDNIALKFEDITLTYKEFNETVNQYAHYFISLGLKKGDVIELFMTNRPEFLFIFTAISKIGAINSLINTELREKTLEYCLKLTPGKLIIVGSELMDAFTNVKSALNISEEQKLLFSPDHDSKSVPDDFVDLSQAIKDFPTHNPSTTNNIKTNDPIAYYFTSGTTGLSKAAKVIHGSFALAGYMMGLVVTETTPNDTIYVALPFFHGTALWLGWAPAFVSGAALAMARKFSVRRFWDETRKFNATHFTYVGELCRYLINQPPNPNDRNNTLRAIIGNGFRPDIWKEFKERFGIDIVCECYGASEGAGSFYNLLNFDCTVGLSSAIYAIVKYDIEEEKPIRNQEGFMEKVGLGESGLCIFECKGLNQFQGYSNKKATEAKLLHNVFKEGDLWFNTGDSLRDLGCEHAQFVDRLGDTFRWKGHNVSTTEVEEVLNVFEQVSFSSVYGVQIPGTDGRAGMAAIVPRTSVQNFNLKALADEFRNNLTYYAVPIFLRFKSNLTITPTFKLKKVKLKNEAFDIEKIHDPIFILLPRESEYTPLTKEIYQNMQKGEYKF
ncbi:MAG: long-chain-acyl-CoA synthetase [Promethearchaeota archaeon]